MSPPSPPQADTSALAKELPQHSKDPSEDTAACSSEAGHTTHHVDHCEDVQDVQDTANNTLATEHEQRDSVDEHINTDTSCNSKRRAINSPDPDPVDTEPEDNTDHNATTEVAKARKKENQWKRKQRKRAKMDQWIQAAGLHTKPVKQPQQ